MNQPKPKQIRLPFAVPKPGRSRGQHRTCGICRRSEGKYTCPRCNLVYCSLACFRDQSHAQCSESFYKSTVMDQIATDPQVGLDDKKDMIEMLRRFEQQAEDGEGEAGGADLDEEEEDELEARLRDIDLEDIDSNKLFHLLPQEHRDAFLAAIRNPESDAARELFANMQEEGEGGDEGDEEDVLPTDLPWWEQPDGIDAADPEDEDDEVSYAEQPEPILSADLAGIGPPTGVGAKLVYNALALSLAYVHVLLAYRLPSLDVFYLTDSGLNTAEVKKAILGLMPFLSDPKSTLRHENARDAYSSVWERIATGEDDRLDPSVLLRLLGIAQSLLHPPITTDPPRIQLVLADLNRLFSTPKVTHVSKKLLFYSAALRQLGRQDWLRVEAEIKKEAAKLESESAGNDEAGDTSQSERPNLLL